MRENHKKWIFIGLTVYGVVLILLYMFSPSGVLSAPLITPTQFLEQRPSVSLFDIWIIIVPSSTIIVYVLGVQILYLGFTLIKSKQHVWGISLLFWSLGTLLAGTSYQGLGYELKCSGNEYCLYTSWFELSYLFTTAISISLMGLAFSKRFTLNSRQFLLKSYSGVALIVYTIVLLIGSIGEIRFLMSYELFVVFFMPLFVVFFVINIFNYYKNHNPLDKSFITLWILFLLVNIAYYGYYIPGFTQSLYENTGIWFSANDVLHVALIGWFVYFQFVVKKKLVE